MNIIKKTDVLFLIGEYRFVFRISVTESAIFQNGAIKIKVDWLIQNLQLGSVFQEYLEQMHSDVWIYAIYFVHTEDQIWYIFRRQW